MSEMSSMRNTSRITDWLVDQSLPMWSEHGMDRTHGGFFELLDFEGEPVRDHRKRMRVQARQMYTYSHAAILGWDRGTEVAEHGFDFLTNHCWHPDGGWIFTINEDGSPLDTTREAYEQAFALLGLSWYFRASADERALPWIDKTLAFLDGLADPVHGGFRESVPDKLPRRQNPHMHLLEASIALYETFNDDTYLERAHRLVELATTKFICGEPAALGEYFTDDWSMADGDQGAILEPGHHFEWAWLLNKYALVSGRTEVREIARPLFALAESSGTEAATGLAYDETCRAGTVTRASKRLWLQTEALKAHLVLTDIDPEGARPDRCDPLVDAMFEHYLKPNGTWQDKLDEDNRGIDTSSPASTMYHLFVAFDEYLTRATGTYQLA